MVRELDSGGARYSQDLSEVDLSDLEDVKVRVNDPAGDVLVHLGSSDYLRRYKIYVTHAQGWRQQFQKLESVDLRYDNQIIVNPDIQRTAKQVALSPAAAKAAAAAGVKPAALVTRLAPHDRAVPKPAFELTEKKLDPKAAAERSQESGCENQSQRRAAAKRESCCGREEGSRTAGTTTGDNLNLRRRTKILPASTSGGQKPSPAVAKSQTSQGPGQ